MTEVARTEGRAPTLDELRAYRERVRSSRESLEWTQSRLQRQTMPETERDKLVREWDASGQEELIRLIGWRSQSLKQEEDRLVESGNRAAFDPITCLDTLTSALDGDEPPTRYFIRDELAYVVRELRRAGSPTHVY